MGTFGNNEQTSNDSKISSYILSFIYDPKDDILTGLWIFGMYFIRFLFLSLLILHLSSDGDFYFIHLKVILMNLSSTLKLSYF